MKARRFILGIVMAVSMMGLDSLSYADWEANLQVSIPDPASDSGIATNKLVFGVNSQATNDFDNRLDVVALSSTTMTAHFLHPEYAQQKTELWKDLQSDSSSKEWDFEVSSPLNGRIQVAWDIAAVPGHLNLRLVDDQTGGIYNMTQASKMSFENTPGTVKKFSVQASENTVSSSSSSSGGAGGGCGMIKPIGRSGGSSPSNTGSDLTFLMILLSPLFWVGVRKMFLPEKMRYNHVPLVRWGAR